MAEGSINALVPIMSGGAPAVVDYGDDAGAGFENTTSADFKTPWIRVLDAKSKDVETVPGAKAGLIINTVTKQLFNKVLFVPCATEAYYVEWKPRGQGGGGGAGFVAAHLPTNPMVVAALAALTEKGGKFAKGADGKNIVAKSPAGNDLIETYYVHGYYLDEETGDAERAIISFSSTSIPSYQNWMSTAKGQKTTNAKQERVSKPLFAHVYRLSPLKKEANGNSWYVLVTSWAGDDAAASLLNPASDLYSKAKVVKAEVLAGKAKVDHANSGADAQPAKSEEIPF